MRARLAAALLALALAAPAAPALAAPALPLGHAGRWITDARGRLMILHGINMVYKLPPYLPSTPGFDEDDAAFLAGEGYNTVRIGVMYKAIEPQPGVYDDAYLERVAVTLGLLARHGIVSLIDFHQDLFNERFGGEGFPDWAVQDDGLPAQPRAPFPFSYVVMPAENRAWDHFWANDPGPGGVGLQDRYAAAWRHVAERFRADPSVLGYELINEPWAGSAYPTCANLVGCPAFDAGPFTAFNRRMLAAIRQVDPRSLVWYEPESLNHFGADTHVGAIGAQAGFAFHDYCLPEPITGTNAGCDTLDDLVFRDAEAQAARNGDALLMTEFGATNDAGNLQAMVDRSDRNMVSWQYWAYCGCSDPTTSGPGAAQAIVLDPAKPPSGQNIETPKLKILSRPYPQLVAGTPQGFAFDPATTTFHLDYTTARADGRGAFPAGAETEIALPARQYPRGYAVAANGAAVLSARGAPLLRLAACPGAREISVRVTPVGASSESCAAPAPVTTRAVLRVAVRPRRVRAGRLVGLRIIVRDARGVAVRGASVSVGRKHGRTNAGGRVTLRVRLRPGRHFVVVRVAGFAPARVAVRAG